jgi:hypothetical protein
VIADEVKVWRGVTAWVSVGGSGFACAFKVKGNLGGCELVAWRSPPNRNNDEAAPSTLMLARDGIRHQHFIIDDDRILLVTEHAHVARHARIRVFSSSGSSNGSRQEEAHSPPSLVWQALLTVLPSQSAHEVHTTCIYQPISRTTYFRTTPADLMDAVPLLTIVTVVTGRSKIGMRVVIITRNMILARPIQPLV